MEELSTHGGSLRIYACHSEDTCKPISKQVTELKVREEVAGFTKLEHYFSFSDKVKQTKFKLLDFLRWDLLTTVGKVRLLDIARKQYISYGVIAPAIVK